MSKSKPTRKGSKKAKKVVKKGTRKLSPALAAWNEKVMNVYRELKKNNPNTKLGDAMKEAKKRS